MTQDPALLAIKWAIYALEGEPDLKWALRELKQAEKMLQERTKE